MDSVFSSPAPLPPPPPTLVTTWFTCQPPVTLPTHQWGSPFYSPAKCTTFLTHHWWFCKNSISLVCSHYWFRKMDKYPVHQRWEHNIWWQHRPRPCTLMFLDCRYPPDRHRPRPRIPQGSSFSKCCLRQWLYPGMRRHQSSPEWIDLRCRESWLKCRCSGQVGWWRIQPVFLAPWNSRFMISMVRSPLSFSV